MNEKNIKSPFAPVVVHKSATLQETVAILVAGFNGTLKMCEDQKEETNQSTLTGYMCGVTATLHAMGFEQKDATEIAEVTLRAIVKAGSEDCDCPNCRKKS